MTSRYRDAIQSVQSWLDSINWSEETGKPFKYKDSEEVLYYHAETILSALTIADEMRWRDISEAQRDGTQILLYQPQFDTITTGNWMKEDSTICPNEWFPLSEATHWMPMPAPTTKDNEG